MDASSICSDTRSIGIETETAETDAKNVRMPQNLSKTQDSLYALENELFKCARLWRRVSVDDGDV